MKTLVSGVLVRLGSLSSEGKFFRACSRVSWFKFIGARRRGGGEGKLPYILSDLKRSRKVIKCFLIPFSCPPQPGPKFLRSIRKSIYRGYIPKNLVPSVLARLGSRSTEGIFLRAWFQLPWFNQKVLSPSVQKGLNY